MEFECLEVLATNDTGDDRGSSFPFDAPVDGGPYPLRHLHVTTLRPGHVRGNHFHEERLELLVVTYADAWTLHWDTGDGTPVQRRRFAGAGAVLVRVPRQFSHAVENDGGGELHIVGLSDLPYDPARPDAVRRPVVT